jgi:D-amino-acid oxidase
VTAAKVDVCVVGAGVCGLTTAVRLAESGLSVRLLAREMPPDTDSCAAGAMWGPFLAEHPHAADWARETLTELQRLAGRPDETGVRLVSGIEASRDEAVPHDWLTATGDLKVCRPDELPPGYTHGWRYTTAAVDMPVYSRHLLRRLRDCGGEIVQGSVESLDELRGTADVLVNCTGSGARTLVPDLEVKPTRGRILVVANPGIDSFFAETGEGEELTWYVPHGPDVVVLGGTLETTTNGGSAQEAARRIVARCGAIEPLLAGAEIVDQRIGYRPIRPSVRVESVDLAGLRVVHNYGHGGSGVSLSWGCAGEVLALATSVGG